MWRVLHISTRRPALHCSIDLRTQTYTEPVPLKYGKRATKYPWIYEYFYSVQQMQAVNTCAPLKVEVAIKVDADAYPVEILAEADGFVVSRAVLAP